MGELELFRVFQVQLFQGVFVNAGAGAQSGSAVVVDIDFAYSSPP